MSRTAVASSRDVLIPQAEGEALFNDTSSLPQRKQAGCSFCASEESRKEKGVISSLPTVWHVGLLSRDGTWGICEKHLCSHSPEHLLGQVNLIMFTAVPHYCFPSSFFLERVQMWFLDIPICFHEKSRRLGSIGYQISPECQLYAGPPAQG